MDPAREAVGDRVALVDTSAFYALADADDEHHPEAQEIYRRLRQEGFRVFTTNFVVAETHALLLARLGPGRAREWLARLALAVWQVTRQDGERGKAIVLKYTDKDFSYCDAVSFAVMEGLGVSKAFTFDTHFRQYGLEVFA